MHRDCDSGRAAGPGPGRGGGGGPGPGAGGTPRGELVNLALYAVSGLLLIVILEQFVQLGAAMRG